MEKDRSELSSTRRPVVGLMTGSFHNEYSRQLSRELWNTVHEVADVYLYQGVDANRYLDLGPYANEEFDWHYYSQFEYSKFIKADLLIISFCTISGISEALPREKFLGALPKVPIIMLEDEYETPNGLFIAVDNRGGMRACVEHLISQGCEKILFVSGPKEVHDAILRRRAYVDVMKEHGLPVEPDMIAFGDFSDRVDGVISELLDRYPDPDALVCANDEMAESAYRVLRARGLEPGKDVLVTGFDDSDLCKLLNPPLTSVWQNQGEIADIAAKLALKMLAGEKPDSVLLPTHLVVRGSSDRAAANTKEAVDEQVQAFRDEHESSRKLTRENMLSALLLRNLLWDEMTVKQFFTILGRSLHSLGIRSSIIGLLKEPLEIDGVNRMFLPNDLRLHMLQKRDQVIAYSRKSAIPIRAFDPTAVIVPDPESDSNRPYMVFPLFYGKTHYGVFIVESSIRNQSFCHTISLEIGTGLRFLYMALDQQQAQKELEEKNMILDYSASHDALTDLFNRAGILKEMHDFPIRYGRAKDYVVMMADLDHLKEINDTFGHDAGDIAIKSAATTLQSALPTRASLGRAGGDEFAAIICLDKDPGATIEEIRRKTKVITEEINRMRNLPFYMGISLGFSQVTDGYDFDQNRMLKEADAELYEDKKNRRKTVVKNPDDK